MFTYGINFLGFFKRLGLVLVWLNCCLVQSGCRDEKKDSTLLIIATSADNPPFEFYDTHHNARQIQGFDIDLGMAIGKYLNKRVEFKDMDFNGLILALQSGRADMVISAMEPTPERAKNIDFSCVYFQVPLALLHKTSVNLTKESFLADKKIGAQMGSNYETILQDIRQRIPNISIISRNRLGELVQELLSGRIEAVLTEKSVAFAYAQPHDNLSVSLLENHHAKLAIALPLKSPLKDDIDAALRQFEENGTLAQLRHKWFANP